MEGKDPAGLSGALPTWSKAVRGKAVKGRC